MSSVNFAVDLTWLGTRKRMALKQMWRDFEVKLQGVFLLPLAGLLLLVA